MFNDEFGINFRHVHNVTTVFYQLVNQVCYLHTLVIVFVAGKVFSEIFVTKGIAPVFSAS